MAGVSKDHNRKAAQSRYRTSPMNYTNRSSILHGIPLDEVCHDENDQVANGDERNNARVFERVQAAKE